MMPSTKSRLEETSVLEDMNLDYGKLGLRGNPFESMPVFSDLQRLPLNGYMKYYLRQLIETVNSAVTSRTACVYLIGPHGSGKSAILKTFSLTRCPRGGILPIYTRFPLAGGRMAFYNEFVKRLPSSLLKLMHCYARNNFTKMIRTYIGSKIFFSSGSDNSLDCFERMKISPQYAISSIADILTLILEITDADRIVLILDEFEHAWARFTGLQKYSWERSFVDLSLSLGSRVVFLFPLLPIVGGYDGRPYMGMYNWKDIDLDRVLKVTPSNSVTINCSETNIKRCMYSLLQSQRSDKRGDETCRLLLTPSGKYITIGEAITYLRMRLLMMVNNDALWVRNYDGK